MKTLLSKMIRYDVETPPAEPAPAAPAAPATPSVGLPPKEAAPPTDGLPPKDPNAPPPEVKTYDFEADGSGLKAIDLKGEKIHGKFDSVEDLAKSYSELEAFKGKKSEDLAKELGFFAPEEYDFGDATKDWVEGAAESVSEAFKEIGMSQDQAIKGLPHLVRMDQKISDLTSQVEMMEEWGVTGEAFKAKETQVAKWADQFMPDAVHESMRKLGAAGMIAAEALMRSSQERPLWAGPDANVDLADVQQKITDVETKMKALDAATPEYKALEAQRKELFAKKNPPKA